MPGILACHVTSSRKMLANNGYVLYEFFFSYLKKLMEFRKDENVSSASFLKVTLIFILSDPTFCRSFLLYIFVTLSFDIVIV